MIAIFRSEALGFHRLTSEAESELSDFFRGSRILPLNETIAQRAVSLRQQRRMGLGDAIIGATAMVHNLTFVTHNTGDFR